MRVLNVKQMDPGCLDKFCPTDRAVAYMFLVQQTAAKPTPVALQQNQKTQGCCYILFIGL